MLHKALRRWVSCPTLFYGWVGIGAYTRRVSKGGTYHPVCIRLAFGMWIPRMLWVGKVGLKVGLKWPSSATGPSPFGSMGLRAGQVKTKTWTNYQVGLSVLCGAKSTPTTCPPNKTPTPTTTMVKLSLFRPRKAVYAMVHHPPWHHPLALARHHSLHYGTSVKGAKGGPSGTGSITGPHITRLPTSSIWMSSGGMPNSSTLLDSRSCPSQKRSSSSPIIHCSIGSYHSLGSLKTLYPPWRKWSQDFHSESQAQQCRSQSL